MMRQTIGVVGLAGLIVLSAWGLVKAADDEVSLGLITGDVGSTSYRIGEDIRALVGSRGIDLTLYHSRGDIENIFAVYHRPGNHLGLVASDVLAFVNRVDDAPRLKLIAKKIKWIFPLVDREVHLVAGGRIMSLSDLEGRRVAIGCEESASYLTSRLLLEIAGIQPGALVAIGGGQALAAIRDGRIDAMLAVDGAPVDWLADWIAAADGLHLVPIDDERIRTFYPVIRIPAGTYAWQPDNVDTVSVKTVLVAYDFHNQYCHVIGKLAWLVREHLAWLRQHGHPKWKTVDVDESFKGWDPYTCVLDFTPLPGKEPFLPPVKPASNPVVDAIHGVFHP